LASADWEERREIGISDGATAMRRLVGYARPHLKEFLIVVGLVVAYILTQVIQPYLVEIVIDKDLLVAHPEFAPVLTIGLLYLGVTILGLFANFMQNRRLQWIGQRIVRDIRVDLFRHIESLSMRFFDTHASGRLITNVSSDTNQVSMFFTNFLLSVIQDGLSLLLVMAAMLLLDWQLALLSFLVIPVIVLISVLFRRKLRESYRFTRTQFSRLIGYTAENLGGMRITQIFHQEDKQFAQHTELNREYTRGNINEYRWSVMFNRTFDALGNISVALMVWLGGTAVVHQTIEIGVLYAFTQYIRQFFNPINSLTQQWNTLQSSMVSAERIGGVLITEPEIRDPAHPVSLPRATEDGGLTVQGEVVFHHVSFGYAPGTLVLRDIDFVVPPRSFVGFVGETGAGKSTLMSVLTRFYDIEQGRITVDGHDIRTFSQRDLHRVMAIVQQEVNIFSGTVADNIRLFRSDVSDRAVREAAEIAGADEFIRALPGGYQAWLRAKGANLSLGQRQLLAFARALTFNPKILILDEATASLDSHTEMILQQGLTRIAEGRTTLVIAHRLSTIRDADMIYVMDQGRIVERGNHWDLMNQGGHYAELVRKSAPSVEAAL
jgi:ATP-binding cassette subfamily B multidrug efflux pump